MRTVSVDESIVEKQFDYFCKLVIKNTLINHKKQVAHRNLHEKSFSELSSVDLNSMQEIDSYDFETFNIGDVKIENEVLYDALLSLPELKRKVIILKYFGSMTDSEIGKKLNLPRTTVQSIRYSTVKILKTYMEDSKRVYESKKH